MYIKKFVFSWFYKSLILCSAMNLTKKIKKNVWIINDNNSA